MKVNPVFNFTDFDYYQNEARTFAVYQHPGYPVLGLAEEAGEVCGKYAKYLRGDTAFSEEAIAKELGDVLWMVANICCDLGLSMADVACGNLDKLSARQAKGTIRGDGDER